MAKLINILAVSLGSGLVMGAGLRALENWAPHNLEPAPGHIPDHPVRRVTERGVSEEDKQVLARLGGLENRLEQIAEAAPLARQDLAASGDAICARLDAHQAETDQIMSRLEEAERNVIRANETNERLGTELRERALADVREQLDEIEQRLARNMGATRQETLDALADGVQHRVAMRIAQLENDVTGQAATLLELRDCSVKTEQSIQKLLLGIDRLVIVQEEARQAASAPPVAMAAPAAGPRVVPRAEPATGSLLDAPEETPDAEATGRAERPQRRRWQLFG